MLTNDQLIVLFLLPAFLINQEKHAKTTFNPFLDQSPTGGAEATAQSNSNNQATTPSKPKNEILDLFDTAAASVAQPATQNAMYTASSQPRSGGDLMGSAPLPAANPFADFVLGNFNPGAGPAAPPVPPPPATATNVFDVNFQAVFPNQAATGPFAVQPTSQAAGKDQ